MGIKHRRVKGRRHHMLSVLVWRGEVKQREDGSKEATTTPELFLRLLGETETRCNLITSSLRAVCKRKKSLISLTSSLPPSTTPHHTVPFRYIMMSERGAIPNSIHRLRGERIIWKRSVPQAAILPPQMTIDDTNSGRNHKDLSD